MTLYDRYGFTDFQKFLPASAPSADLDVVQLYAGKQFQDGRGWGGESPPVTSEIYPFWMATIKRYFRSGNLIREVTDRRRDGVIGREPAWGAVPPTPALDDPLTAWWDERDALRWWQQTVADLLLRQRLYLRPYLVDAMTTPTGDALAWGLKHVFFEAVPAEQAVIWTDRATRERCSVVAYTENSVTLLEVSYLNDAGATVLRVLNSSGDVPGRESDPLPLNGRLWLYELSHPAMITPSIIQAQVQHNLAATLMGRNVHVAGHRPLAYLNAAPPEGGFKQGAGIVTQLYGEPIRNDQGEIIGIADPSVWQGEASPVDHFEAVMADCRAAVLTECQQAHVLLSDQGTASGRSRIEARAEYAASLQHTKGVVDGAIRWLLGMVATVAALRAGIGPQVAAVRWEAACRLWTGPLSPDERRANREDFAAGGLSLETWMSRNEIDDPTAEMERLAGPDASVFAIGDRVRVVGPAHMPGQRTGTIALVNGTAYGILFDDMPEMGVHKWYVAEELALIDAPAADETPAMAAMEM